MADDRIKILEERLTRLEATLTQRQPGIPGGGVVDPAAFAATQAQLQFQRPIPSPVVDPAPWPYWGGGWGRPWPWPTPIVDPLPFPNPVVDPAPWRSHIVDPAVFAQSAATLGRIGRIADPPPPDFSRLSVEQLEATIHSIAAERARLDAMEQLVNKQLDALKQQQTQKPG